MKASCKNCLNLDMEQKEMREGRLQGKYQYGCKSQKSGYICGFLSCDENLELFCCRHWSGHGKKKIDIQKLSQEYDEKLQQMYDRWSLWEKGGCPEAEVPDGVYLNRIRGGIEKLCRKIEKLFSEDDYPECYYAMFPPLMDEGYMANGEEIRKNAERALSDYENQEDYLWLSKHVHELDNRSGISSEAYRLICHAGTLRETIQEDDLFRMKQESRQEHLIADLAACRAEAEKMLEKPRKRKMKKSKDQIVGQIGFCGLKAS